MINIIFNLYNNKNLGGVVQKMDAKKGIFAFLFSIAIVLSVMAGNCQALTGESEEKMNKLEFIDELASHGEIDLTIFPAGPINDAWFLVDEPEWGLFSLMYISPGSYDVIIDKLNYRNPPTLVADIAFQVHDTLEDVEEIERDWLLARLDDLYASVPVPTKMNKLEFIDELASRGGVDLSAYPTEEVYGQWYYAKGNLYYVVLDEYAIVLFAYDREVIPRGVIFWDLTGPGYVEELDRDMLLARLDDLYAQVPTKMNKLEFIDELASRGGVDLSAYPTEEVYGQWYYAKGNLYYVVLDEYAIVLFAYDREVIPRGVIFWDLTGPGYVEELDRDMLLARLDDLYALPPICDDPTSNHASGCALLLFWDKDNDGIISHDEMMDVTGAYISCKTGGPCPDPISQSEVSLIGDCYDNFAGVIADKCPGCVYAPPT